MRKKKRFIKDVVIKNVDFSMKLKFLPAGL